MEVKIDANELCELRARAGERPADTVMSTINETLRDHIAELEKKIKTINENIALSWHDELEEMVAEKDARIAELKRELSETRLQRDTGTHFVQLGDRIAELEGANASLKADMESKRERDLSRHRRTACALRELTAIYRLYEPSKLTLSGREENS